MVDFDAMLADLGKSLGIALSFTEDGTCELLVDERIAIALVKNEVDGLLTLSSAVADALPDPVSYPLVLDLLDLSLGAAISRTPAWAAIRKVNKYQSACKLWNLRHRRSASA